MSKPNPLERIEQQLEKVIEQPFAGRAPFDVKELDARLRSAIAEVGTPYVPDRWYVRFPVALQARDSEVRAWVEATWRETLAAVDPQHWAEAAPPHVDVAYDASLQGEQLMVGYEYDVANGPLYGLGPRVRRRAHTWDTQIRRSPLVGEIYRGGRSSDFSGALLRLFVGLIVVGAIGLAVTAGLWGVTGTSQQPSPRWPQLPQISVPAIQVPNFQVELPRLQLPSLDLPRINLPGFSYDPREYVVTTNINIRRQPSAQAPSVGVLAKGETVRFDEHSIVQGEAVQGESRWVEVTPLTGYVTGQREYIWYGALQPKA